MGSATYAPQVFATPDEALAAMKAAFHAEDQEALLKVFGSDARPVIDTGDPVSDALAVKNFAAALDERAELITVHTEAVTGLDGQNMRLRYGKMGLDMRIPLVQGRGGWYFDTARAVDSLQELRMALDELRIQEFMLQFARAQEQYHAVDRDGDGVLEYAQRGISTPGKKDGLYWETGYGESDSPLAKEVAKAVSEGYSVKTAGQVPFHGYRFKVLRGQGPSARGGAYNYLAGENMTRGFALLAYPDKWSVSGKNTVMVGPDGQIYRKDLGPNTSSFVKVMSVYDPNKTWLLVERPPYSTLNPTKARKVDMGGEIPME